MTKTSNRAKHRGIKLVQIIVRGPN